MSDSDRRRTTRSVRDEHNKEAEPSLVEGSAPTNDDKARARALVKERIKGSERTGNPRPLAVLNGREAAIHARSAAQAKLSRSERMPDENLLSDQLMGVARAITGNSHLQMTKRAEVVALYAALQSRDPIESMLDRVLVATDMAIMDSFARALQTNEPRARELNLRFGMKGAQTLAELIKLRDSRRGQGSQLMVVGKVNVESGGHAIVGPVKTTTGNARRRLGSRSPRKKTKD